ncbi:glycosyltransferase family 2 protein [Pseudoalteromonas sp. Angola-18]|uniref:glycosyltransferase family 2 protein n=1 Tax=Pseudoalteromonas sp. Angola-18 TaxID=3025338 RepID=UPI002358E6C7|nr:glycosyltransferase family 2 protein [Pseudoalteromonas sp. Angola-18]MDC9501160.1 glycosyltransferase family 2 protein [Pseudoalteromonas sp. Angola-18]
MVNVAALTVIKDEAPYITDWINHCFFMGFSEVYIAINRSCDDTKKVVKALSVNNKNIKVFDTTWLDMFPNKDGINMYLQYYSFCFLLNEASYNEKITHFFPLDADEFWFSYNFGETINEYLSSKGSFDILSVPWAAQSGDDKPFELPFKNINITVKENVKSILSRSAVENIGKYLLHIPEINKSNVIHLDANGEVAQRIDDKTQRIKINTSSQSSLILHRMLRSEQEYLALLTRQRPSSTLPIKDNRWGFHKGYQQIIELDSIKIKSYFDYLEKHRKPVEAYIELAKSEALNNAQKILKADKKIIVEHISKYIQVLKGTALLPEVIHIYSYECTSYSALRDTAISLEKINLELSLKLMKAAEVLRPEGQTIKRKIAQYLKELNK